MKTRPTCTTEAQGRRHILVARRLLWAALLSAFFYSAPRTAADVSNLALNPVDLIRGVGPVVLAAAGWVVIQPRRRCVVGTVEIGIGMFLAVALASALWSAGPVATFSKAAQLTACYIALHRLATLYDTREDAARALATWVHVALLATALQYILVPGLVLRADGPIGVNGLPTGLPRLNLLVPQISANPLAAVAVVGILAIMLRVGPRRVVDNRVLSAALVPLYLWILLGTRTRIALAVGVVLFLVLLVTQARRRPGFAVTGVLGLAILALAAWTPERLTLIQGFLTRGQDARNLGSLTGRTEFWQIAVDAWREGDQLLGLGFYVGHRVGLGLPPAQSNIDSTWVEVLVDVGLLGLVPLVIAAVAGLRRVARGATTSSERRWLLAVAVYGLVVSFFNPTLQAPGAGLILLGLPIMLAPDVRSGEGVLSARGPASRTQALPRGDRGSVPVLREARVGDRRPSVQEQPQRRLWADSRDVAPPTRPRR